MNITDLPKWAQVIIADLRRDLAAARSDIAALHSLAFQQVPQANVFLRTHMQEHPIARNGPVVFKMFGGTIICHIEGDVLDIHTDNVLLNVGPRAANHIIFYPEQPWTSPYTVGVLPSYVAMDII